MFLCDVLHEVSVHYHELKYSSGKIVFENNLDTSSVQISK